MNAKKVSHGSAGLTQDAVLVFGGEIAPTNLTEQWNGTSWTEVGDMAAGTYGLTGTGTSSLALAAGRNPNSVATEEWTIPLATVSFDID